MHEPGPSHFFSGGKREFLHAGKVPLQRITMGARDSECLGTRDSCMERIRLLSA